ncbi:MAG: extracellular solute-binding protein [Oscillospiraceae bacterium]|nr:extracellular solute-binding protein [Oscillospiraceae bacterium]
MKKILAIVLAALMLAAVFSGCGKDPGTSSGGNTQNSEAGPSKWPSGYYFNETDFQGQELYLWNLGNADGEVAKEFMEATGVTIKASTTEYRKPETMVAAILAGKGADLISIDNTVFPAFAIRKILIPVTDVINIFDPNVVNQDHVVKDLCDYFSYNGECYGFNFSRFPMASSYIIYRRSMIEEAGLDDPYEVWQRGEWSYDKFKEYCAELSYDSNDDGVNDVFGCAGAIDINTLGSVGENPYAVRWDEEGRPRFALTDPDLSECLQFINDMRIDNTYLWSNDSNDLIYKKAAMFWHIPAWHSVHILESVPVEDIGWVQIPYATSNTSKLVKNLIHSGAIAVPSSATGREALVAEWIKYNYCIDRADTDYEAQKQKIIDDTYGGSEEWFNFAMTEASKNVYLDSYSFGALETLMQPVFWSTEGSALSRAQSVAYAAQQEIDEVFYGE